VKFTKLIEVSKIAMLIQTTLDHRDSYYFRCSRNCCWLSSVILLFFDILRKVYWDPLALCEPTNTHYRHWFN